MNYKVRAPIPVVGRSYATVAQRHPLCVNDGEPQTKLCYVGIEEVRATLIVAAMLRGLTADEAQIVANYYLDAELRGIKTHGIAKFLVMNEAIKQRQGKPQVVKEAAAFALVDGKKELGVLAANYCVDLVGEKAHANGIGLVALKNSSRYSHLAPFTRRLAAQNLIGIVTNAAGPAAVAPHGSYMPLFGTNPISIAFPAADVCDATGDPSAQEPLVVDMATSQATWGEIRQALIEEKELPLATFYTATGAYARDPRDAYAVKAHGGAKGFALCLAIEVLCGALIGTHMGNRVSTEYDLGFLFIALNPLMFRDSIQDFATELDELKRDIHQSPPLEAEQPVRIPGERANALYQANQKSGEIELALNTWQLLCKMSLDPSIGLTANNQLN